MRKVIVWVVAVTTAIFTSCGEMFDDSKIWEEFDKVYDRIEELEELCKQTNTNITSLQAIIDALQQSDYITNVAPIKKEGEIIGYTISFCKSAAITIYNGTDGSSYTPQIGVKQDITGTYYWTLDGNWLLDSKGNKVKAQGTDGTNGKDGADGTDGKDGKDGVVGEDGITPKLEIRDGYWYVSYDNGESWVSLGKATGEDSEDSNGGDSLFSSVTEDDQCVYFTLADGTVLVVPKMTTEEEVINHNTRIYYTSTDGNKIFGSYFTYTNFGAVLLSNTYKDGIGVITFDEEVTTIGGGAFRDCTTLKTITIPASVENIGISAFYNCTSLESVYCKPTTVPTAQNSSSWTAFDDNAPGRKIYVNPQLVDSYRSAAGWERYAGAIVAEGSSGDGIISKIKYTTTDNTKIEVADIYGFGGNYISHQFDTTTGEGTITFEGELVNIPAKAFYNKPNLLSISVPDTIKKIGDEAFVGCISMTEFVVPSNLESIGYKSFGVCESLQKIVLPEGVKSIGQGAFIACTALKSISIGSSVTTIGNFAFERCSSLAEVVIPDSVKSIGSYAFYGCTDLKSITLSNSLTEIPEKLLWNCSSLTDITLPNGITSIGTDAFNGCCSLTEISIPDGVTLIDADCFGNCTSLKSIALPESLTTMGQSIFDNCKALESIVIPSKVTEIPHTAFWACKALKSVTIGSNVKHIDSNAFKHCTAIESLNISDLDAWFDVVLGSVESNPMYSGASLMLNGSAVTSLTVPTDVTKVGSGLFCGCNSITSVTFHDGVTEIGTSTFQGCAGITSINLPNALTTIGSYAFEGCGPVSKVTIPATVATIGTCAFTITGLQSVHCLSTTPCTLVPRVVGGGIYETKNVYDNFNYAPVYVPASAVDTYKAAVGWKELDILPEE